MKVFYGLQDYFLDQYTRKDTHQGISVNIHMFPFLHCHAQILISKIGGIPYVCHI
jgi:hypothetical protein